MLPLTEILSVTALCSFVWFVWFFLWGRGGMCVYRSVFQDEEYFFYNTSISKNYNVIDPTQSVLGNAAQWKVLVSASESK